MKWLSIETSSPQVSLAMGEDSRIKKEVSRIENASTCIEPLFKELDITLSEMDLCIIGQGPGSYNGLRVGYGFLKGLLCLHPKPVVQIPTPLILASEYLSKTANPAETILVVNNARRGEIYSAMVEIQKHLPRLIWQKVTTLEALKDQLPTPPPLCISYDYTSSPLTDWADHPFLSILPTAAQAALTTLRLALPASRQLSHLEPHYVRSPVPESFKPVPQPD